MFGKALLVPQLATRRRCRGRVDRGTFKSDASARGTRQAPMAAVMHNIGPYEDDGCVPSRRDPPSHSPL